MRVAALWLCACSHPVSNDSSALRPADVDLARYLGTWFIIGSVPYHYERGDVGRRLIYTQGSDGVIDDVYQAHPRSFDAPLMESHATARVIAGTHNAEWSVRTVWPLSTRSVILYVSPDYRYTVAGSPDRAFAWVLAREAEVDDATYQALLAHLGEQGFDITRLRRVPQRPQDIGRMGDE